MKVRSMVAAVGAGILMASAIPATAQAADPVYPPEIKPVTCSAKAVSGASKIKINMGPNLPGNGYYRFRLQKKVKGGWAQYTKTYTTQGKGETRTINVKKGTWRAKCYSRAFPVAAPALDATSNSVKIKR